MCSVNMKILILSYFDQTRGPIPFIHTPETVSEDILYQISELMNFYPPTDSDDGFFIHSIKGFKSANLLFELENEQVRGGRELFLISILLTEGDIKNDLALNMLKNFIDSFRGIKDIHQAFHYKNVNAEDRETKRKQLEELFNSFYHSIPIEEVIQNQQDLKIFFYGLSQAGKTTIIKKLQHARDVSTIPTTNVGISRVNMKNLSILTYDAPGQYKFRDLWINYLESQNALVFVFDVSDKDSYSESVELLHKIASLDKIKEIPVLILINKIDLGKPDLNALLPILKVENLKDRKHMVFLTSGLTGEGIQNAFNWLMDEIGKPELVKPAVKEEIKFDECIIFSRWDDTSGLEIISVHPNKAISDPELIAIRCFSLAEVIYGGKSFCDQVCFNLPMTHLNAEASIYFDSVENKRIRGGKLPLSLVLLYKNQKQKQRIDKMKKFITKKLTKMKKNYEDKEKVTKYLEDIYEKSLGYGILSSNDTIKTQKSGITKGFDDFLDKF
ncbi:MAG: GTP-binding protein [Candidatus Lokiarchaeota archaeon]|nr:GTP-binding protein [Candidatus Lokiarchaeota archaeon]